MHTLMEGGQRLLVVMEGQHRVAVGEKLALKPDMAQAHVFDATGGRMN
ncbi:hypothetical protein [Mesorhizobium sp. CN2-181]